MAAESHVQAKHQTLVVIKMYFSVLSSVYFERGVRVRLSVGNNDEEREERERKR